MSVDVVIVNWNGGPELLRAVRSAQRFGAKVIVVDNASTAGSLPDVEKIDGVTIIHNDRNVGFAAGCNAGARAGSAEIVMLLNPDAEILSGSIADLETAFEQTRAIALTARMVNRQDIPIRSVYDLPDVGNLLADLLRSRAMARRIRPVTAQAVQGQPTSATAGWVVGSAMAIRRSDWDRLGGMDEGYFLWYEDLDFGARLVRSGGTVAFVPGILVKHEGASTWVRLPRRRRQWLRIMGTFRYARQHLGLAAAAVIALAAPSAMAIGVAQDVAHFVTRRS